MQHLPQALLLSLALGPLATAQTIWTVDLDPAGSTSLTLTVPQGTAPGTIFWFQAWTVRPTAFSMGRQQGVMYGTAVILELEGPVFRSQADEENFFACIYAMPGFVSVRGVGRRLELTFAGTANRTDVGERVTALCARWDTSARASEPPSEPSGA